MKLTSLAARLDRLEQQRNPLPALIVGFRHEDETEAQARARTLAAQRIADRPGLTVVLFDWADRDC